MREEKEKKHRHLQIFEGRSSSARYPNIYIPEASLYDEEPPIVQKKGYTPSQRIITVFGYSMSNLDAVMRKFKEHGEIKEKTHGKNWMDIEYKTEPSMYLALKETGTIINGEMIGVLQKNRKNLGILTPQEKECVFVKKGEGVITKILAYLFG